MSFTQDDLEAIDAALKKGVLSVRHGETMTTYRSVDELIKVRTLIFDQLNPRSRRTVAKVKSGILPDNPVNFDDFWRRG